MGIDLDGGAAQPATIDDGCVVKGIGENGVAFPRQRGDNTQVGHKTCREKKRTRAPGKPGKAFFQPVVLTVVTTDQVRRRAADTVPGHPVRCSGNQLRM